MVKPLTHEWIDVYLHCRAYERWVPLGPLALAKL
jgi:hypothetical protein